MDFSFPTGGNDISFSADNEAAAELFSSIEPEGESNEADDSYFGLGGIAPSPAEFQKPRRPLLTAQEDFGATASALQTPSAPNKALAQTPWTATNDSLLLRTLPTDVDRSIGAYFRAKSGPLVEPRFFTSPNNTTTQVETETSQSEIVDEDASTPDEVPRVAETVSADNESLGMLQAFSPTPSLLSQFRSLPTTAHATPVKPKRNRLRSVVQTPSVQLLQTDPPVQASNASIATTNKENKNDESVKSKSNFASAESLLSPSQLLSIPSADFMTSILGEELARDIAQITDSIVGPSPDQPTDRKTSQNESDSRLLEELISQSPLTYLSPAEAEQLSQTDAASTQQSQTTQHSEHLREESPRQVKTPHQTVQQESSATTTKKQNNTHETPAKVLSPKRVAFSPFVDIVPPSESQSQTSSQSPSYTTRLQSHTAPQTRLQQSEYQQSHSHMPSHSQSYMPSHSQSHMPSHSQSCMEYTQTPVRVSELANTHDRKHSAGSKDKRLVHMTPMPPDTPLRRMRHAAAPVRVSASSGDLQRPDPRFTRAGSRKRTQTRISLDHTLHTTSFDSDVPVTVRETNDVRKVHRFARLKISRRRFAEIDNQVAGGIGVSNCSLGVPIVGDFDDRKDRCVQQLALALRDYIRSNDNGPMLHSLRLDEAELSEDSFWCTFMTVYHLSSVQHDLVQQAWAAQLFTLLRSRFLCEMPHFLVLQPPLAAD
ncbi:MAG: hypothetical protein MHM6MM_004519 [Cercozoa sp. M6MM]